MYAESGTLTYEHGRFRVDGGVLPNAITAYRTYGDPENPCIVFPTCYGGRLDGEGLLGQDYMIGKDKALNPEKYFIVTLALFSNGESSSPSNTPPPYNGPYFPSVSYQDNVRAQYAVLTKVLGINKAFCVIGFSMGGSMAYHWAVMYPNFVERYVAICGSARTSPHNKSFLEGPKAALVASKDFYDGHYTRPAEQGVRAFGRVYCAWAYGQTWFREHKYLGDGQYASLDDFMRARWEGGYFPRWDANDMLTLLATWQTGDVSRTTTATGFQPGDLSACLASVKPRGLIMPCKTDLYFPPEDSVNEVACMQNTAKLVVIDSIWGHLAGGGNNAADDAFIKNEVAKFFNETS